MSEQNDKMTAKQFAVQAASMAKPPYYSEPFEPHTWVLCAMDNYAAQQVEHATAELRKELEAANKRISYLQTEYKEQSEMLDEAQRQRDEALKSLKDETQELHELLLNAPVDFLGTGETRNADQEEGEFREAIVLVMNRVEAILSRLSYGETNPGIPWISVKERPLVVKTETGWIATPDGESEFLAAVPYTDKRQHGELLWWIRHCIIEDDMGLYVVGDDDNAPAGWSLEDVDFYWPLPAPPESLTDKPK